MFSHNMDYSKGQHNTNGDKGYVWVDTTQQGKPCWGPTSRADICIASTYHIECFLELKCMLNLTKGFNDDKCNTLMHPGQYC